MGIKGLTDEQSRLPRVGKLRTGHKVRNAAGKEYPQAVDYFMVGEGTAPDLEAAFKAEFGDKPTEISPVYLPVDDIERATSTFYRLWSQSRGLICKGDGKTARRLVDLDVLEAEGTPDPATGRSKHVEYREIGCTCKLLEDGDCRPMMMLQFMIPKLPGVGIWQIDTSSYNSIRNVTGSLEAIRALAGSFAMVPLRLSLIKKEVTPEGQTKKKVNVLELGLVGDTTMIQLAASTRDRSTLPVLAEPDDLPTADDEPPDRSLVNTREEVATARSEERGLERVGPNELVALAEIRKQNNIETAELRAQAERQYQVTDPTNLTIEQYEELVEWCHLEGAQRLAAHEEEEANTAREEAEAQEQQPPLTADQAVETAADRATP